MVELLDLPGNQAPTTARLACVTAIGRYALNQARWATAQACFDEAVASAELTGDRLALAFALHLNGTLAITSGKYRRARDFYAASLVMHRELGNRPRELLNLIMIARLEIDDGRTSAAARIAEAALSLARSLDNESGAADSLSMLGQVAALADHLDAEVFWPGSRGAYGRGTVPVGCRGQAGVLPIFVSERDK